jgi:signal peptidase I
MSRSGQRQLQRQGRLIPVAHLWRYMAGVRSVLCVLTLVGFLTGCGRLYTVPTSSMAPTIKPGDVIIVDPSAYSSGTPKRWDVIIFKHPLSGFTNVSRVVGLPGETISIERESIVVGGTKAEGTTWDYERPLRRGHSPLARSFERTTSSRLSLCGSCRFVFRSRGQLDECVRQSLLGPSAYSKHTRKGEREMKPYKALQRTGTFPWLRRSVLIV